MFTENIVFCLGLHGYHPFGTLLETGFQETVFKINVKSVSLKDLKTSNVKGDTKITNLNIVRYSVV